MAPPTSVYERFPVPPDCSACFRTRDARFDGWFASYALGRRETLGGGVNGLEFRQRGVRAATRVVSEQAPAKPIFTDGDTAEPFYSRAVTPEARAASTRRSTASRTCGWRIGHASAM